MGLGLAQTLLVRRSLEISKVGLGKPKTMTTRSEISAKEDVLVVKADDTPGQGTVEPRIRLRWARYSGMAYCQIVLAFHHSVHAPIS